MLKQLKKLLNLQDCQPYKIANTPEEVEKLTNTFNSYQKEIFADGFKITDDNDKWSERKTIKPFMFPFSETSINILKCLEEYLYLERMGFDLVYTKTKNAKQTMKRVHYWGRRI